MKEKVPDICTPIPPRRYGSRRNRYEMLEQWYGTDRAKVEISAHTCQPKKLDILLDEVLTGINRPENGLLIRIKTQWAKIIGPNFSRFCEPESLREEILTLKVRHSALLMELKPSCDIICRKINRELGENVCKEIRLAV